MRRPPRAAVAAAQRHEPAVALPRAGEARAHARVRVRRARALGGLAGAAGRRRRRREREAEAQQRRRRPARDDDRVVRREHELLRLRAERRADRPPHGTPPCARSASEAPSADARKSTTRPFVDASRQRLCRLSPKSQPRKAREPAASFETELPDSCRRPSSGGVRRGRKSRTAPAWRVSVAGGRWRRPPRRRRLDLVELSSRRRGRVRANFRQRSREESDPRVARMRLAMLILTLLGIASGLSSMPASVGSVVNLTVPRPMSADDSVESTPAAAAGSRSSRRTARARARRDEQSAMASAVLALAREREPVKGTPGIDGAAGNRVSAPVTKAPSAARRLYKIRAVAVHGVERGYVPCRRGRTTIHNVSRHATVHSRRARGALRSARSLASSGPLTRSGRSRA